MAYDRDGLAVVVMWQEVKERGGTASQADPLCALLSTANRPPSPSQRTAPAHFVCPSPRDSQRAPYQPTLSFTPIHSKQNHPRPLHSTQSASSRMRFIALEFLTCAAGCRSSWGGHRETGLFVSSDLRS